jgi:hypothetical protein
MSKEKGIGMRAGVVGASRIGGNGGSRLARSDHEVVFGFSRDTRKLEGGAGRVPGAREGAPTEAVAFAARRLERRRVQRAPDAGSGHGQGLVAMMEAPRRPGARSAEAYRLTNARRISAAPPDEAARLADEPKVSA